MTSRHCWRWRDDNQSSTRDQTLNQPCHQPDLADAALGVAEHNIPAQGNQVMDAGLKTLQVEASIPSLH